MDKTLGGFIVLSQSARKRQFFAYNKKLLLHAHIYDFHLAGNVNAATLNIQSEDVSVFRFFSLFHCRPTRKSTLIEFSY